ncbi:hypothetical protein F4780DRAFT_794026 [Xylariomycetidae sp. FL0641]|nr:hypothetical protein F4780DRAFT_794026 [Xylariomycetidae sp. FL0641]
MDKPALEPPPGVIPNFDNPPNGNIQAHVGVAICLFLVTCAVLVRGYSKVFCAKRVELEDYLALIALAPYLAFVWGVYTLLFNIGYYVHQWNVRFTDLSEALYIIYICTSFYEATMATMKAAILRDWVRVFVPRRTPRNGFFWACYGVLGVNVAYYATSIVLSACQCRPHALIWDKTLAGRCIDAKAILVASAAVNLASDLAILLLPQRVIWGLHMSRRKKISVSLVFAVGLFACIAASVRLSVAVRYHGSDDVLYGISSVSLWCLAEMTTAFLVFGLPAAPKAFAGCSPRLRRLFPTAAAAASKTTTDGSGSASRRLAANTARIVTHIRAAGSAERRAALLLHPPGHRGILRTTRLERTVEFVDPAEAQGVAAPPPRNSFVPAEPGPQQQQQQQQGDPAGKGKSLRNSFLGV